MQAEDHGAGGGPVRNEAEGSAGDPYNSDGPGGPQGRASQVEAESRAPPSRGLPVGQLLGVSGPGGDASPWPRFPARSTGGRPGGQLLHYNLRVPFRSAVQAEIARQFLAPRIQLYQGAVTRQFLVSANWLIIRLTAEDRGLIQSAVNFCLHQICVLIWTVMNILHPVLFTKPRPDKRG
ncbi:cancer/testis antigen 1-like [Sturnira hondurensis]|uniref:cancer/testis antigen 1-like n=1 Tax=Sturnira hondurensis TaxID=192404 RepID=UPI0018791DE8|nr:cancer/testis antigen 1-like [Sturnira hondurensis]